MSWTPRTRLHDDLTANTATRVGYTIAETEMHGKAGHLSSLTGSFMAHRFTAISSHAASRSLATVNVAERACTT